jgi:dynactin complex subunit
MSNEQPEALRLADAIDPLTRNFLDNLICGAAATELRRQHAEIERLRADIETLEQEHRLMRARNERLEAELERSKA